VKIFHPETFQGNLQNRHYFEGWYFKHVSADGSQVISVIPGVSLTPNDPHGFIQVLNGMTGQTWNIRYPLNACTLSQTELNVRIGQSTFSLTGIHLYIDQDGLQLKGEITFSQMIRYPSTTWQPGIMGPFTFVPRMECKHGVISIRHALSGGLQLNAATLTFDGGTGYIEKDWGTSFPEAWIWVQGNTFHNHNASIMFSLARVPWLGRSFNGFLCFFYADGRLYRFTTYNFAKIHHVSFMDRVLKLEVENRTHTLRCTVTQRTSGQLKAPVIGTMDRIIRESADSDIAVELMDRSGKVLYKEQGTHAGLEVIEEIFQFLPHNITK